MVNTDKGAEPSAPGDDINEASNIEAWRDNFNQGCTQCYSYTPAPSQHPQDEYNKVSRLRITRQDHSSKTSCERTHVYDERFVLLEGTISTTIADIAHNPSPTIPKHKQILLHIDRQHSH